MLAISHRSGWTALLLATIAFAALAAALRPAYAANANVSIANFSFAPGSVSVNIGESVTWTHNDAGIPHTVSSDTAGAFDSGTINSGATFVKTFDAAGTFTYHCNIHPSMTGTVLVTGASAPTATPTPAQSTATTSPATATTAAPTATSAATQANTPTVASTATTVAPTAAISPTSGAAATATSQPPAPPATGDNDGDDGGNGAMLLLLIAGVVVLAGGGGAFVLMRRRA